MITGELLLPEIITISLSNSDNIWFFLLNRYRSVVCAQFHNKWKYDCSQTGWTMFLECSMTFRGNWFPKMEWNKCGHDNKTNGRQSVEMSENHTTITSTLVVPAHNILMPEENLPVEDSCFEFTTYFNRPNESVAHDALIYSADNDPNFKYTWISPKINILCMLQVHKMI